MLTIDELTGLFIADFEAGKLYWRASPCNPIPSGSEAGHISATGYVRVKLRGKRYMVHTLLWAMHTGAWPDQLLDHVNGVGVDNRIENLRPATASQNMANRRRGRGKYPRGVRLHRNGYRWYAVCNREHLGMFDTMEEASAAYLSAAQAVYGDFARGD